MHYFAYGSNMNREQMDERCPSNKYICPVKLSDYRFVYDGYSEMRRGAVANVIESPGDIVWGGLFEISEINRDELDYREGYPTLYNRKTVEVRDGNGNIYVAFAYLRSGRKKGLPSVGYREQVMAGAKDCGLPTEYIDKNL